MENNTTCLKMGEKYLKNSLDYLVCIEFPQIIIDNSIIEKIENNKQNGE
jgi:hypothetical protein